MAITVTPTIASCHELYKSTPTSPTIPKIVEINNDRVFLSIKALKENPWEKIQSKYSVGDTIDGVVVKINDYLLLWLDDVNLTIESGNFKIFNRVIYNLIAVIGDDYIVKSGLNDLIYYFFNGERKIKNFKDRW